MNRTERCGGSRVSIPIKNEGLKIIFPLAAKKK